MVDGGTAGTRESIRSAIDKLPKGQKHLELVVVSHIDNDHIAGVLTLLEEVPAGEKLDFTIGDFWFNGWPQLHENPHGVELYGVEQGEKLTKQITDHKLPWNQMFGGKAVVVPNTGELPQKRLPGGMRLTILSPKPEGLRKMKEIWQNELVNQNLICGYDFVQPPVVEVVERFGTQISDILDFDMLARSDFEPDVSDTNRSSIALVAEYDGKRILLTTDAHADILLDSLQRYSPFGKTSFDLVKVSHHGAQGTTNLELIQALECRRFVFSTNGSIYHHPHAEAVARVIEASGNDPELIFNYKCKYNGHLETIARLMTGAHAFHTTFPQDNTNGITVNLG
jgi:metal-dependent hydrolase (beta-lactamase superfamily II)